MITERARARARRHPELLDGAGVIALMLVNYVLGPAVTSYPAASMTEVVLTAVTLAAVLLRHRWPLPALASTTAGAAAVLLLQGIETLAALGPVLALYTVSLRTDRRTTVLAWASMAAVLASAIALGVSGDAALRDALQVLPWSAAVAAVGAALRSHRAYLAAVEERAVRAERGREEEARRRVAEERVRIARELHDVVAHHIAVVGVQAGVAQHLLSTDPGAATAGLGHVRRAAATVLEELGDILSVLREPGEQAGPGRAPAPGLDRLEELIGSFAAAGLAVEWSLHGQPRAVAPTVDLVAYRVLEEALTNAVKHGTGSAQLSLEYGPATMTVHVVNHTPALLAAGRRPAAHPGSPAPGGGHGLVGMRERAAAVGGTLRTGPGAGDTFCVEAELPLRKTATS